MLWTITRAFLVFVQVGMGYAMSAPYSDDIKFRVVQIAFIIHQIIGSGAIGQRDRA